MTPSAEFYDHALNHTEAAQAHAVARARRDSIADGTSWRVEFSNGRGQRFYWDGCRYDALQLARDIAFRNPESVELFCWDGTKQDPMALKY